jgi:hypothetical protein
MGLEGFLGPVEIRDWACRCSEAVYGLRRFSQDSKKSGMEQDIGQVVGLNSKIIRKEKKHFSAYLDRV